MFGQTAPLVLPKTKIKWLEAGSPKRNTDVLFDSTVTSPVRPVSMLGEGEISKTADGRDGKIQIQSPVRVIKFRAGRKSHTTAHSPATSNNNSPRGGFKVRQHNAQQQVLLSNGIVA